MDSKDFHLDFVKCPDCGFISNSQGGLGVHRSKMHNIAIPDDVESVNVIRPFPEGKPFHCCLCDVTIGTIANFRRHFKSKHKSIKLIESAKCLLCGQKFPEGRGAGIHLKRKHQFGTNDHYTHSPTPVTSFVDDDRNVTIHLSRNRRARKRISSILTTLSNDMSNSTKNDAMICCDNDDMNSINICDDATSKIITSPHPPSSPSLTSLTPLHSNDKTDRPACHPLIIDPTNDSSPNQPKLPPPKLETLDHTLHPSPSSPPRPSSPTSNTLPIFLSPTNLLHIPEFQNDPSPESLTLSNDTPPDDPFPLLSNSIPEPEVSFSGDTNGNGPVVDEPITPEATFPPTDHQLQYDPISNTLLHSDATDLDPDTMVSLSGATVGDSSSHITQSDEIPFHSDPDLENASELVRFRSSKVSCTADINQSVVEKGKEMLNSSSGRRIPRPASHRPNRRLPHPNRKSLQNNPLEARRIQTLYRQSKKRAARQTLKENNVVYTGSKDQANQYFSDSFSTKYVDIDEVTNSLHDHVPSVDQDANIMAPFNTKEIRRKLMCMSNSAPGPDKVEYRHLKLVDPNCTVLSQIFNRCLLEKKIPNGWKQSATILIYKKGDSSDPSNFRPIALMSCFYKLFTSLFSTRVSQFAVDNDLMSTHQKST